MLMLSQQKEAELRCEYKFAWFLNSDFRDQEIQMVLIKFVTQERCWRDVDVTMTNKQGGYAGETWMLP